VTVSALGPHDVHVCSTAAAHDQDDTIRALLALYLGVARDRVPIARDAGGRPTVGAAGISLSVSHSGDDLVVAVAAGQPVGVDVECLRAGPWNLLPSQALTPSELATLEHEVGMERDRAFLRFWTRKEALLKAAGVGLAVDPRELEVSGPGLPASVLRVPAQLGRESDWSIRDIELPGLVAAVALAGPVSRVCVRAGGLTPLTES